VQTLYVIGTTPGGKTVVLLGLALKLKEKGFRVGFLKPNGTAPGKSYREDDEDAVLLKAILELPHSLETIVPTLVGPFYLSSIPRTEDFRQRISASYDSVRKDIDLLLVGGSVTPYAAAVLGTDDLTLAAEWKALVILVNQVKNDYSADRALFFNRFCQLHNIRVLGNIFTNVPRPLLDKTKGIYKPLLEQRGYNVLGVIPFSPEITAPTVEEFYDALGGELLTEGDYLDRRVEDVVVGTMTIESALTYLRRSPNKAVITGGDRSDMALTALETSTSVIILTGGLYPNVRVIARANEKKVPVILVHYDTYTAVEKLHEVSRLIKPEDEKTIKLICSYMDKYLDWPTFFHLLDEHTD